MDNQTIESIATHWLVRREGDVWTQTDQAELEAWLRESTLHKVAFIRLDTVWQQMARLGKLSVRACRRDWFRKPYRVQNTRQGATRRRWYATAAGFALALVAGTYLFLTQVQGQNHYTTPVGGLETLSLADGSRVILNTNTTIRVRLERTQRRIDLESGEAYFSVAKDPSRPFVIFVSKKTVTALGTEFSLRRTADELQLVVTEGRVQLTTPNTPIAAPATTLPAGTVTRILGSEVLTNRASEAEMAALLELARRVRRIPRHDVDRRRDRVQPISGTENPDSRPCDRLSSNQR